MDKNTLLALCDDIDLALILINEDNDDIDLSDALLYYNDGEF